MIPCAGRESWRLGWGILWGIAETPISRTWLRDYPRIFTRLVAGIRGAKGAIPVIGGQSDIDLAGFLPLLMKGVVTKLRKARGKRKQSMRNLIFLLENQQNDLKFGFL